MNSMKVFKFLSAAMFAMSIVPWAHAGNDTGNGGVSVVCRDNANRIKKAEILDIFEGKNQYDLTYELNNIGLNAQIDIIATRLASDPNFLKLFSAKMDEVKSKIVFLRQNVGLEPTNDAFPIINEKGCRFEQLANFANDGNIYVDSEIFNKLDETSRVALYVHEAVYAIAREVTKELSSVHSRKLTAYLLTKTPDKGVIQNLMALLMTSPTPPTPAVTNWARVLREGLYQADNPNLCPIQIDYLGDQDLLGTYQCLPYRTVKISFSLNNATSCSSTDFCNYLLSQMEIVGSQTFMASWAGGSGSKCTNQRYFFRYHWIRN